MTETIDAASIPARLREGFRRFYTRAYARRGVILGTNFVEPDGLVEGVNGDWIWAPISPRMMAAGKKPSKKLYIPLGSNEEWQAYRPDGGWKSGPATRRHWLKVNQDIDHARNGRQTVEMKRKADSFPVAVEILADRIQARAEALYLGLAETVVPSPCGYGFIPEPKKAQQKRAFGYLVGGLRLLRQNMESGMHGKNRQPAPLELEPAIGSSPDKVRMSSPMPDPSYMEAGAATPLIRAERIRSAEAARAAILHAAERTEGGRSAARILLGGSSREKEAAARNVSEWKVRTDLDIVSRIAATAALAANSPD